jgi:hypothetical protein
MSSFEQRRVIVQGETMPLRVFLQSKIQPWRWPTMLASGGIRVEFGTRRVANLTLDYQLSAGETVVIDDAFGNTWSALIKLATSDGRDYLFGPGRRDTFVGNKCSCLMRHPKTIDGMSDAATLEEFVGRLTRDATAPIRHLVLVGHANPFGDIFLPMRPKKSEPPPDSTAGTMTWESLQEAIDEGYLDITGRNPPPVVTPRPENVYGRFMPCAVIIRGCRSGVHPQLLERVRQAFGGAVNVVVMPKFFDAADFVGGRGQAAIEYFMHDFTIGSTTRLKRDQVLAAFKAAKFRDWLGVPVPDGEWDAWVNHPVGVSGATAEIKAVVPGREALGILKARYEFYEMSPSTEILRQGAEPTADEMKAVMLERWGRMPQFTDTEWPMWERLGYESFDAFGNAWAYRLDPSVARKAGEWAVQAVRFTHTVRTPLIDRATLICDYHPLGERGTQTFGIDYNDTRIFGHSRAIPKGMAQTLDRD